jgi:hypothetical protein
VSLDEQAIVAIVRSATRRARLLAIAEGITVGIAAAAASRVAGLVAAISYVAWRWQDSRPRSIVEVAERRHPELRNLLFTWKEISDGTLAVTPSARERVIAMAAYGTTSIDLARIVPATRLAQVVLVAAVAWSVVGLATWRRSSRAPRAGGRVEAGSGGAAPIDRDDSTAGVYRPPATTRPTRHKSTPSRAVR